MNHRKALSWVGRRKRRECAQHAAMQLAPQLANKDDTSWHRSAVLDADHLEAFRSFPMSQPLNLLLKKLTDRVRNTLQQMGHHAIVDVRYIVRDGKLLHLEIYARQISM